MTLGEISSGPSNVEVCIKGSNDAYITGVTAHHASDVPSIGVLGVPCDVTINGPPIAACTRSSSPSVEEIFFLGSFLPDISIITSCTQLDNKHRI
jgi:hypothetical protein